MRRFVKGSDDELSRMVGMFDSTWRCVGVVKECRRALRRNDCPMASVCHHCARFHVCSDQCSRGSEGVWHQCGSCATRWTTGKVCNPLAALPVWYDGKQLVMGDSGRIAEHASLFNCRVVSPEQLGSREGSAWQPRKLLCDYMLGCESVLPKCLKDERGVMVW